MAKDKKDVADDYSLDPNPAPSPLTTGLPAEDYLTEQEKSGPDPVPASVEPGPAVETIEDLGIGVKDPYPTGNPPAAPDPEV